MMKLVYGTTNKSKILFMKKRVEPFGIGIVSLDEVGAPLLDVDESGSNPLENAKIKALAYYRALHRPVFSCDSGLFIDGLDSVRQPGVHVRTVEGSRLDDAQMIAYYSALALELGGTMTARYQNGICLVVDENHIYEYMGEDIASERFVISSRPHKKRTEGFPLDSLSIQIESGQYYYDLADYTEKYTLIGDGFAAFFMRALGIGGTERMCL